MIVLTPRKDIPLSLTLVTPIVAITLTLIIGAVIFALLGYDPGAALYQFFIAPISRPDQVDLFVKACPLIIIARACVLLSRQYLEYWRGRANDIGGDVWRLGSADIS